MVWRLRALARGGFYSFGQMALRSARARGRAGFFFELVLAPVARGMFSLLVKWLCAPRGPEGRVGFFFKLVLALVARGMFSLSVKWLCAPRGPEAGRGVSNPPSLPLDSTLPATS